MNHSQINKATHIASRLEWIKPRRWAFICNCDAVASFHLEPLNRAVTMAVVALV